MADLIALEKEFAFAFDNFECYGDDDQLKLVVALPKCLDMQKVPVNVQTPVVFGLLHFFISRHDRRDNHSGIPAILVKNNEILIKLVNTTDVRKNMIETVTPKRESLILEFLDCQQKPDIKYGKLALQNQIFLVVNSKTADKMIAPILTVYNGYAEKYLEATKKNKWASRSEMDWNADILRKLSARYHGSNAVTIFKSFHRMQDDKNLDELVKMVPEVRKFMLMK